MSAAQALLARCRDLGAELTPTPHGTLKVKAPAPLPEDLRQELKRRKPEILPLIQAMSWLRSQLAAEPKHISDLFFEWCAGVVGRPSPEIDARIDLLNNARWALGVEAYIGEDERFWWRLPREIEQ